MLSRSSFRLFSDIIPKSNNTGGLKGFAKKWMGRTVVYRLLLAGTIACTSLTIYLINPKSFKSSMQGGSGIRYTQPAEILELGVQPNMQDCFIVGVIKPGTLQISPNTQKHSFVLTDFIHEIMIHYDGILPTTWREGETARVQGSFVDEYNPVELVATLVQGAHDSEKPKTTYQPRSRDVAQPSRKF